MENRDFLKLLSEARGISGFEKDLAQNISKEFENYVDDIQTDKMGNLVATKYPDQEINNPPEIMLAAHMDEIGLMVTKIDDDGFLRFTYVGGVDPRTLLGQEVIVHGKKDIAGIIGAKPPHLTDSSERNKAPDNEKLFIDIAHNKNKAKEFIQIGDVISLKRNFRSLQNNTVSGKSLDDRAGVLMIYQCLKELSHLKHKITLRAVTTVQEEVGVRGAITSSYSINPDIGIAIDVCHADMPGVAKDRVSKMNEGPAIAIGPHVHPQIHKKLTEIAKELDIDYQLEPSPYPGGTDAWGIQIARSGVATGLISIPLRYMHTSVETLSLNDIKKGGQLLAQFIARIDDDFVEGLTCY
ncbi:MAG: M42 family metallopeptidase [Halanaerobiales bacterium]